jgi:hypothetical protein
MVRAPSPASVIGYDSGLAKMLCQVEEATVGIVLGRNQDPNRDRVKRVRRPVAKVPPARVTRVRQGFDDREHRWDQSCGQGQAEGGTLFGKLVRSRQPGAAR